MKTKRKPVRIPAVLQKVKRKYTKKIKQVPTTNNWISSNLKEFSAPKLVFGDQNETSFGPQKSLVERMIPLENEWNLENLKIQQELLKQKEGPKAKPMFASLLDSIQNERTQIADLTNKIYHYCDTILKIEGEQKTLPKANQTGVIGSLWNEAHRLAESRETLKLILSHLQKIVGD